MSRFCVKSPSSSASWQALLGFGQSQGVGWSGLVSLLWGRVYFQVTVLDRINSHPGFPEHPVHVFSLCLS